MHNAELTLGVRNGVTGVALLTDHILLGLLLHSVDDATVDVVFLRVAHPLRDTSGVVDLGFANLLMADVLRALSGPGVSQTTRESHSATRPLLNIHMLRLVHEAARVLLSLLALWNQLIDVHRRIQTRSGASRGLVRQLSGTRLTVQSGIVWLVLETGVVLMAPQIVVRQITDGRVSSSLFGSGVSRVALGQRGILVVLHVVFALNSRGNLDLVQLSVPQLLLHSLVLDGIRLVLRRLRGLSLLVVDTVP